MSNVDDQSPYAAGPLQARMLLYERGMAIPAETMLIGDLRATTPEIEDRFATAIGSAPVLLGDLRKLTPRSSSLVPQKYRLVQEGSTGNTDERGLLPDRGG
jgi:alpha-galactosidase